MTGKMSIKQISSDLAHGLLLPQPLRTNSKGVSMKRSCAMLRGRRVLFLALVVSLSVIVATPSLVGALTPAEPVEAIHVSELTQALETIPARYAPTGPDTTGYEWYYPSFHYFVAHESLEEALRSDGTPFHKLSDPDIAAGRLLYPDGAPRY